MGFFGRITGKASALSKDDVNALKEQYGSVIALTRECEMVMAQAGKAIPLSEQLVNDLLEYVIYLCSADGKVMPAEVEAINSIFGSTLSQAECERIGKEIEAMGESWQTRVPPSFAVLYEYIKATRTELLEAPKLGLALVDFYRTVGIAIAHSDCRPDDKELQAIKAYCDMLTERLKK
ncbi:MAG: hypothetical protein IJ087_20975 [Eggerthellaceae bacterium]|nr:hypothetical protein [Eggerthellaceae bacterium]